MTALIIPALHIECCYKLNVTHVILRQHLSDTFVIITEKIITTMHLWYPITHTIHLLLGNQQ